MALVIPAAVAEFVQGGVEGGDIAIWIATANAAREPQTCRSMGARVDPGGATVYLFVPEVQGARVLANARAGALLAATFVRIHDYRAVQVKGEIASARVCEEADRGSIEEYRDAFAGACSRVGLPRELIANLTCWPATRVEVRVRELYAQTPGPNAGTRL